MEALPEQTCFPEKTFPGLQRLICTALADPELAARLLDNPGTIMEYLPANIVLTHQEYALVAQVKGTATLASFAAYLHILMQDAAFDQAG